MSRSALQSVFSGALACLGYSSRAVAQLGERTVPQGARPHTLPVLYKRQALLRVYCKHS